MGIGQDDRAADRLETALRELYHAEIDAQQHDTEDSSLVWARAQASLQLSSTQHSRYPLFAQAVAAAVAAAILAFFWEDATAGVAGLILESGAAVSGYWASRVSEIVVAAPAVLFRTLLS